MPPASYLSLEEKRVYDLVARRFIAVFYPDCEFNQTTVLAKAGEMEFKATGKQIVSEGWRELYKSSQGDNTDSSDNIMPIFAEGESGVHTPSSVKKTTQPPKYYTEGTLLRAMETAGKLVDDEELREAMKENGIGRPSTRAAIIETLFKRKYIIKEKKNLKATAAGIALIDTIKVDLLKSAKLTGLWENKLRKIESKEYDAAQFISELKAQISDIVINVLSDNSGNKIVIAEDIKKDQIESDKPKRKPAIKKLEQIVCPICGKGHIIKGKTAYGCSEYQNGCTFRVSFDEYSETMTPAQLNKRINLKYKKND